MIGIDGIVAWMVEVESISDDLWPRLDALLDAAERERAAKFHFSRHRRQYTAAHVLKRLMLSLAVPNPPPPETWRFATGKAGKPYAVPGPAPWFNLSHCEGMVACALSQRVELGVDVESLDRHAPLELAGRYFAPAEKAWLDGLPPALQRNGFFQLWTLKEAFIKAIGMGLSQPLDSFAFNVDLLSVTFVDPALGDPTAWLFEQRFTSPHHMLALAWRTDGAETLAEVRTVRLETLLQNAQRHGARRRCPEADATPAHTAAIAFLGPRLTLQPWYPRHNTSKEVAMPEPERIDRRRAALIAYDVCRRALTPPDPARREAMRPVLDAWVRLIAAARAAGVPVIYTTPVSRADGADVVLLPTDLSAESGVPPLTNGIEGTPGAGFPEEIAPQPEDYVFLKRRPSAFYGTGVAELLHMLRRDVVIIGGGATNRGVETSVREAFNLDVASIVVRECCWGSDAAAHAYSLDKAMKMYARIRHLDQVAAMLRE